MEIAQKSHNRKIKSIINNNKLECNAEYKLIEFNTKNMKRINVNNNIINNILYDIQKVQNSTNDELYEFKNKNVNNKLLYKNEKNKLCEKDSNDKLNTKNTINNNIKRNSRYKDVPLTAFFK